METEKIRVARDDARDIVFQGQLIAEVNNRHLNDTRWTQLKLWRTARGRYVLQEQHLTCWQGERDTVEAMVLDDAPAIRAHYGEELPNLHYALYAEAAEDFPELEVVILDELESAEAEGAKLTTELYFAVRRTGDSLWVDTSAAAETLETAQELARFAERALPDLEQNHPLVRVSAFKMTEIR